MSLIEKVGMVMMISGMAVTVGEEGHHPSRKELQNYASAFLEAAKTDRVGIVATRHDVRVDIINLT